MRRVRIIEFKPLNPFLMNLSRMWACDSMGTKLPSMEKYQLFTNISISTPFYVWIKKDILEKNRSWKNIFWVLIACVTIIFGRTWDLLSRSFHIFFRTLWSWRLAWLCLFSECGLECLRLWCSYLERILFRA